MMEMQQLLAPPGVASLAPPYREFTAVPDLGTLRSSDLADGSLLAVGLSAPRDEWPAITALVPRLRARFPAAPVVLRVERRASPEDLDWVRRAGVLQVRAVLFEGETVRDRLERALTDTTDLPEQVEQWLAVRLPRLPPAVAQLIVEIFRLAPLHHELGDLLARLGHAERTTRTWFLRAGVPGPAKWLGAAHAVRAALRLQADQGVPLLTVAVEGGYSDHSSLSRQSLRLFGVRPGTIRTTLGWEWLLDRWLRRASREPTE
jgi:AraC-like DNA-binding protein